MTRKYRRHYLDIRGPFMSRDHRLDAEYAAHQARLEHEDDPHDFVEYLGTEEYDDADE